MTSAYAYDVTREPPAPVAPLHVSDPGRRRSVALHALVDSGADITVVPESIVRLLGLPAVSVVTIEGAATADRRITLHAALVEMDGLDALIEVAALGEDALLGRDVLNRLVLTLDGPRQHLIIARPAVR